MGKRICVRCGYCCLTSAVVIVIDPEKGIAEDNLRAINGPEERCPHLTGAKAGEYSCSIHHYPWFKDTPCGQYNNVAFGTSKDTECPLGLTLVKQGKNNNE